MISKQVVVDAHGCVLCTRVYLLGMRVCTYIHGVGFCIAYLNHRVFSGPLSADKQFEEIRVFYLDSRNNSFPRLDKDLANSQRIVEVGIFVLKLKRNYNEHSIRIQILAVSFTAQT